MYKLIKSIVTGEITSVQRIADNTWIPICDEANTDYQAYLKYVAEGGIVLPADNTEGTV